MSAFSYPNSDHASPEPAQPAESQPAAPTGQPSPAVEPGVFSYSETNKPEPKGAAAEHVPEAVRELRQADDARRMYSPQKTYAAALPVDADAPEEIKAAAAEWREVFADWETSPNEARELVGEFSRLTEIPADDTVVGWQTEAEAELRRVYGNDAKQALAHARALVARDPRVKEFLNATGLGSHPKFVLHAARIARSQRMRGRLK